ncbi:MAG: TadE family protein [Actinomycetota bacterium]
MRRNERGAALVEFALVTPVLLILTLTAWEFTLIWLRNQAVINASQSAARAAAQAGTAEEADQAAVRAAKAALGDRWDRIDRIVIYALDSDGSTPAACVDLATRTSPGGARCNVYTQPDVVQADDAAHFSCGGGAASNWCPTTRNGDLLSADWLGVRVDYNDTWVSNVVPWGSYTLADTTVMRIEPRVDPNP